MAKMDAKQRKQLTDVTCPLQSARLRALLMRMEMLQGYRTELTGAESADQVRGIVAAAKDRGRTVVRHWLYDTGAAKCTIGRSYLSDSEKSSIEAVPARRFSTANGIITCTSTAWCKVPHLGMRRCFILENDCSPLVSVGEDINDYGNLFYWGHQGPVIETVDGKSIRLQYDRLTMPTPMVPDEPDTAYSAMRPKLATEIALNGKPATLDKPIAGGVVSNKQAATTKVRETKRKRVDRSINTAPALTQAKKISTTDTKRSPKNVHPTTEIAQAISSTVEMQ